MPPALFQSSTVTLSPTSPPLSPSAQHVHAKGFCVKNDSVRQDYTMDVFLPQVTLLFQSPLKAPNLLSMSARLQEQFKEKLQSSKICMLPSYNHTLPTGHERGRYLAVDLGGSNLRVALVELGGKPDKEVISSVMDIVRMFTFRIDNAVRTLRGHDFFDWMAERIDEAISEPEVKAVHGDDTLPMGISWSFPVEQTSIRDCILLEMGKGFCATQGILGDDLRELIMGACKKRNLKVCVDVIINDGSATLLSRAYCDPATRFSVILGTGSNASIILPVSALANDKFGSRPKSWHDKAEHVLVNTEFSMFGKGILPVTRWDERIDRAHIMPGFQPFEHLISGRYLGEIVRQILLEAIQDCDLFQGQIPERFLEPYALDTSTLAMIESDSTPSLHKATAILHQRHPLASIPSLPDVRAVQQITQLVSHRAAALLATAIHALWSLRASAEGVPLDSTDHATIGCNGAVIENYPSFREACQRYLDELTTLSGAAPGAVTLEIAVESAIFGAAVAVGCLEGQ